MFDNTKYKCIIFKFDMFLFIGVSFLNLRVFPFEPQFRYFRVIIGRQSKFSGPNFKVDFQRVGRGYRSM